MADYSEPAKTQTKAMADTGEASLTGINMGIHDTAAPKLAGDPVDHKAMAEELAKTVASTVPVLMSDEDAAALGREVESRYVPPPPAPTVLEQIAAQKK
jgi:hypothetical protein